MDPAPAYQELAPMQGNKSERHAGAGPAPQDHIIWSIFNLVYCNPCCLGILAVYFSIKSRDRKVVGDVETGRTYGSTARSLNIAASAIGIAVVLLIIILYATMFATFLSNIKNYRSP